MMVRVYSSLLFCALVCGQLSAQGQQPEITADMIMSRVAANQDKAEAERNRYIYVQHARVISRKGKMVMCEEITDSRILPSAKGSQAVLLRIDGRQWEKDHYATYTALPEKSASSNHTSGDKDEIWDDDMDRDLVESMRAHLTNDKSKDGLEARLFPPHFEEPGELSVPDDGP